MDSLPDHLFFTEAADISLIQPRNGVWITTSGTDINRVAAHMEKYRVERAPFVTDGLVRKSSQASEQIMERTELATGLGRVALGELSNFTKYYEILDH